MTDQTVGGHTVSDTDADRAVITLGARLDALEAQHLRATVDDLLDKASGTCWWIWPGPSSSTAPGWPA